MKSLHSAIGVIVTTLTLPACMGAAALSTPATSVPDKQVRIYDAHAYPDKRGVLVIGQVSRRPFNSYPFWGHLHVVASLGSDRPPLVVDTKWRWRSMPRRGMWFGSFSALLPTTEPAQIESVWIEYRSGSDHSVKARG
jgi:hypothetical protein